MYVYAQPDQVEVPSLDSTARASIYIPLVFAILKSLKIVKLKRLNKEKNLQNDRHSIKTTILVQISTKNAFLKQLKNVMDFLNRGYDENFNFLQPLVFIR